MCAHVTTAMAGLLARGSSLCLAFPGHRAPVTLNRLGSPLTVAGAATASVHETSPCSLLILERNHLPQNGVRTAALSSPLIGSRGVLAVVSEERHVTLRVISLLLSSCGEERHRRAGVGRSHRWFLGLNIGRQTYDGPCVFDLMVGDTGIEPVTPPV